MPQTVHVDSNVLLRFLTGEPAEMAEKAVLLFQQVEDGRVKLFVEEIIFAETVWVLQSFYKYKPEEISTRLMQLLASSGVESPAKDTILRALLIYGDSGVRFGDALLAAHMISRGAKTLYSFDSHFDRIPGIRRLVPGQAYS